MSALSTCPWFLSEVVGQCGLRSSGTELGRTKVMTHSGPEAGGTHLPGRVAEAPGGQEVGDRAGGGGITPGPLLRFPKERQGRQKKQVRNG